MNWLKTQNLLKLEGSKTLELVKAQKFFEIGKKTKMLELDGVLKILDHKSKIMLKQED